MSFGDEMLAAANKEFDAKVGRIGLPPFVKTEQEISALRSMCVGMFVSGALEAIESIRRQS